MVWQPKIFSIFVLPKNKVFSIYFLKSLFEKLNHMDLNFVVDLAELKSQICNTFVFVGSFRNLPSNLFKQLNSCQKVNTEYDAIAKQSRSAFSSHIHNIRIYCLNWDKICCINDYDWHFENFCLNYTWNAAV